MAGNSFTPGHASGSFDPGMTRQIKTRKITLQKPRGGALVDLARA
jgi:hypothetical protein